MLGADSKLNINAQNSGRQPRRWARSPTGSRSWFMAPGGVASRSSGLDDARVAPYHAVLLDVPWSFPRSVKDVRDKVGPKKGPVTTRNFTLALPSLMHP